MLGVGRSMLDVRSGHFHPLTLLPSHPLTLSPSHPLTLSAPHEPHRPLGLPPAGLCPNGADRDARAAGGLVAAALAGPAAVCWAVAHGLHVPDRRTRAAAGDRHPGTS